MNGAESLVRAARSAGIEVCFSNPGTSEMPLVAAFDSEPGLRGVLVLFEGVASGAADGYGRMAEKPALTLFHLGPGHGNAVANLHNAKRGRSPVVNLVGDHATWHRRYNPPLASDIKSLARPVSDWFRESRSAASLGRDVRKAIATAWSKPGRVATLTVPTDCQWSDAGNPRFGRLRVPEPPAVADDVVEGAGRALRGEGRSMLLIGAYGTRRRGLLAAARVGAATGCRLGLETFPTRLERGPDLPLLERVPYFPEQGRDFFGGLRRVVLAGALDPVAFFGYPSGISRLIPDGIEVITLARPEDDVERALDDLAGTLDAPASFPAYASAAPVPPAAGPITAASLAQAIAAAQPEGAVVVDEGITSSGAYLPALDRLPAVDLPRAHRRRDRVGAALRHRRRARRARPQGDRARGRRQRSLHHPVAVDPGARAARRRQRGLRQRHLPHPADRAAARWNRASGTAGTGVDRSRPTRRSTGPRSRRGSACRGAAPTPPTASTASSSARSPSRGRH